MRILSWNVNGIRAGIRKGFIDWFNADSPDILCIQETKAHPEQLKSDILNPEGYTTYWNNPERKGYAGVAILSKKEPINVIKDFGPKKFDTEGRMLAFDYGDFILINVYFPNGGMGEERLAYKLDFYEKFLKFIDKLENRNILVCGDVNTAHKEIDLARPKQNENNTGFLPEERAWLDKLVSHDYIDTFRMFNTEGENYTWWDYKTSARERNVGWRIDYFFASKEFKNKINNAFILTDVQGSDHCPLGVELK